MAGLAVAAVGTAAVVFARTSLQQDLAEVQVAVAGDERRLEAEARVLLLLGDAYEPLDQTVVETAGSLRYWCQPVAISKACSS